MADTSSTPATDEQINSQVDAALAASRKERRDNV